MINVDQSIIRFLLRSKVDDDLYLGVIELPTGWGSYQSDQRGVRTAWEERYFVLCEPNVLHYYPSREYYSPSEKPLGTIYLEQATLYRQPDQTECKSKDPKKCFKVSTPQSYSDFGKKEWTDASYVLSCQSSEDLEGWIQALMSCGVKNNEGSTGRSRLLSTSLSNIKEGYLENLEKRSQKWRLLWFELRDGILYRVSI